MIKKKTRQKENKQIRNKKKNENITKVNKKQ